MKTRLLVATAAILGAEPHLAVAAATFATVPAAAAFLLLIGVTALLPGATFGGALALGAAVAVYPFAARWWYRSGGR